jgi:ribonuclease P protein component
VTSAPTLPRTARILAKKQFDAIFASGLRLHSTHFRLHWLPETGLPARLGLAIAKRYVKRAVDRNRLKRHAREAFRHSAAEVHGIDFIIYAKGVADDVDGNALQRELAELFRRARDRKATRASAAPSSSASASPNIAAPPPVP